ncbi:aminotransferase class I/II-fold pyridoxal phosphate-dependent enzyme [Basilea psittacipulmonis]|uniref:Aminotransferase class I/classII large domain-containing protein n=1 Tax=Basilea psittacipulmonis DSM 24701 TaxID=1072685 RepID=A0A077DG69_9BURK|nr:8-amino-7-oxononanoate synthase [Basilea psittacipulmonis]AIL32153.1 hypothetical protein IX83_01390 [Basilea psittacipulmonis DSM 24701]
MSDNFYQRLNDRLSQLREHGQYRQLSNVPTKGIDLLSNDYLGLSRCQHIYKHFLSSVKEDVPSSCASRLLGGSSQASADLEQCLAQIYQRSALYLNSGYLANIGILPAITDRNDLIIADKDIHASLIDGLKLCRADFIRFPHQDYDALERLIIEHRSNYRDIWVVTESIFSMDGSVSDLKKLVQLKQRYQIILYVDEAHSIGQYQEGLGWSYTHHLVNDIDIIVMPCAKAIASYGAIVLCHDITRNYLINTCRSLIFASALPPLTIKWTQYVFEHRHEFEPLRLTLQDRIHQANKLLNMNQSSPIFPIVIGDSHQTLAIAQALKEAGIIVGAIRHPTVPKGKAQLRLCINALLSEADLIYIAETIHSLKERI